MVGHYWLRNPALAPDPAIRQEIEQTLESIKQFAAQVHGRKIAGAKGPFKNLLLIGIGGSALGSLLIGTPISVIKQLVGQLIGLLKPSAGLLEL